MGQHRIAIVGVGATGTVLAAAILSKHPETVLVGHNPGAGDTLLSRGLRVSGAISCQSSVKNFISQIKELKHSNPNLIFLAAKTFHLDQILKDLGDVYRPGIKIISAQNGLGTEDLIADKFGTDAAFRISLNFGVSLNSAGQAEVAFFNRPNHLGSLTHGNRDLGIQIAELLTECGLDTDFVDDIKLFVWKKMVMKCTMASICAVTNKTIKEALEFGPTKEIADACFKEALAVARVVGYDIGGGYVEQAVSYLMQAGVHRDSMCSDIENKAPTEIDFLGGKVVEYARQNSVPTPYFIAMTNLVKAIEDQYLEG
ncbi:MAG: 2-dehydropantoate 2-reductase [Desulfobacterales bacterium]